MNENLLNDIPKDIDNLIRKHRRILDMEQKVIYWMTTGQYGSAANNTTIGMGRMQSLLAMEHRLFAVFMREHAIEFACVAMIGTRRLNDDEILTLRADVKDFYLSAEWHPDFEKSFDEQLSLWEQTKKSKK